MKKVFVLFRIEDPTKQSGYTGAGTARGGWKGKLDELLGAKVESSNGDDIGKLDCIWEDTSRQASFLGVKTGWLGMGKIHVVPAHAAEFNRSSNTVRVPYDKETIQNAPSYAAEYEMTAESEREVYDYYGRFGARVPTQQAPPVERRETTTTSREEARIPLHEEQLKVGKREVEVGGVRLRKIIRTETVQQPVELKREELVVEKVPASEMKPGEHAFEGEDIYIPLRSEEPVIQKETLATEEVRVRKEPTAERRTVAGTVRKEEVETEKTGKVEEHPHR